MDPNQKKDDYSTQSKHAYDVLWFMFLFLFILGISNIWMLKKLSKFRKPIFSFYASSLCVILLRVVLFMDQWFNYPVNIYVVILVTMPTYIYLITGMSQVMLNVECIVKYKNFVIKESEGMTHYMKKCIVDRNNKILTTIYFCIFLFSVFIIVGFMIYQVVNTIKGKD